MDRKNFLIIMLFLVLLLLVFDVWGLEGFSQYIYGRFYAQTSIASPDPILDSFNLSGPFSKRTYSVSDSFFERAKYPKELVNTKESDLVGLRCSPEFKCIAPYTSCSYYPAGIGEEELPKTTRDPKLLQLVNLVNIIVDHDPVNDAPVGQVDHVKYCELEDGRRLFMFGTPINTNVKSNVEYVGVISAEGKFDRVGKIFETIEDFKCGLPLQLTLGNELYYDCGGVGTRSIYKINLDVKTTSPLFSCAFANLGDSKTRYTCK